MAGFHSERTRGYVSWERFEQIQTLIASNLLGRELLGCAREGQALLAGLLRCRRCGHKLTVRYTGNHHDVLRYSCWRGFLDNGEPRCIAFGGIPADEALGREVLRVVQPAAVEAAILASEEQTQKRDQVVAALQRDLEAAQYAARRAQKQFDATDPENRLVANDAVRALANICTDQLIASALNRSGLPTGRGNRWSRERVTALRTHHEIACCNGERCVTEGWMNQTQAAAFLGISAGALRQVVSRGEIEGQHPLADDPWVFNRRALQTPAAFELVRRIKSDRHDPTARDSNQSILDFSNT